MNNKNNKNSRYLNNENLTFACQQLSKNNQQLDYFYARNKTKFPPILQSRNLIFQQFSPCRFKENLQYSPENKQPPLGDDEKRTTKRAWIENKPNVCKIVFRRQSRRCTRKMSFVNTSRSHIISKDKISQTISQSPSRTINKNNTNQLKLLSQFSMRKTSLMDLLQQIQGKKLSTQRYHSDNLPKKCDNQQVEQRRQNSIESLNINSALIANPEIDFLKYLRNTNRQFPDKRQGIKLDIIKNVSRASFYKNANGLAINQKRQTRNRSPSRFEPWSEAAVIQQDFIALDQLDK